MEKIIKKNLAYNLKVERAKKELTQANLAEIANISPKHLTKIENCQVMPSIYLVYKLAKVLKTSIDKLISSEKF